VTSFLLPAVVALAFAIEAAMGFGATIVTVALASLFMATGDVLPAFVPLNVILSAYLVARNHRAIDGRLLVREVLPAVVAGMPVGILAFRYLDETTLRLALGAFVIAVSAAQLLSKAEPRPLPRAASLGLLGAGGVVHGAFGAGGPLVVYVLGRRLAADKAAFRATLSCLWLATNAILAASYAQGGQLTRATAITTATLLVPLLLGLVAGERVHRAVPAERFRSLIFLLLLAVGVVLAVRAGATLLQFG
jgi:hypothetical protein